MSFLQGLGGGLGNGQSYSNATKTMGQEKCKEGVHAVSPHCFCSTNHTNFFQREKLRPRERKVISPRMQNRAMSSAPVWRLPKMGFLLYGPSLVPILAPGERGRQSIFLAQMLGDSMGPLLSGRKTTALNRPDNALLSTLNLRVLPDRSGVGRF